jgi:aerobic-type carbon monoxide dehydrogenase small subunit (CoxS/CutS family)
MREGALRRLHRPCAWRCNALLHHPIESIGASEIGTIEATGAMSAGAKIQKAWLDQEVVQCG